MTINGASMDGRSTDQNRILELAREMRGVIKLQTRAGLNPDTDPHAQYYSVKSDAPEWVRDVVRAAHDDAAMLPNDHRYEMIVDALDALIDADGSYDDARDALDDRLPVMFNDLVRWLDTYASARMAYCDDAISEYGIDALVSAAKSNGSLTFTILQTGYRAEQAEVLDQLFTALGRHADEDSGEADESDSDTGGDE